ncbi:MAG: hypothetical protein ACRBHB_22070 [Arenicella sp.]
MRQLILSSTIVLTLFFSYFSFTAYWLPHQAGPDYHFSRAAANFYYDHERLVRLPQDEDKLVLSAYGNSRLLRPPFSFYFASIIAKLPGLDSLPRYYAYRVSSAFVGALTLAIVFAGLLLFFNSYYLAWLGTLSIGLLPQYTFTVSYLNDDTGAFLAVSLVTFAMILIARNVSSLSDHFARGAGMIKVTEMLQTRHIIFFGLVIGFTIINKKSAWIFVASAILFYVVYILSFDRHFFKRHIQLSLSCLIAGGWWVVHNMLVYGWNDPLLSKAITDLGERFARIDLSTYGFQARGVGMIHLLVGNYQDFIGATYKAVVGHLDWLKLRVGSLQYDYYLWIIIAIVGNFLWLLAITFKKILQAWKQANWSLLWGRDRQLPFEWILYISLVLQILLYTWTNVHNDIQIQGKYLIPIALPMLLLALQFFVRAKAFMLSRGWQLNASVCRTMAVLIMLSPILVHIDALVDHVIPFYWPDVTVPVLSRLF